MPDTEMKTVDVLYQITETPKAFFVCIAVEAMYNTDGIRVWVPKSIASLEGDGGFNLRMELPVWFYEKLTMPKSNDHPAPLDYSGYPF